MSKHVGTVSDEQVAKDLEQLQSLAKGLVTSLLQAKNGVRAECDRIASERAALRAELAEVCQATTELRKQRQELTQIHEQAMTAAQETRRNAQAISEGSEHHMQILQELKNTLHGWEEKVSAGHQLVMSFQSSLLQFANTEHVSRLIAQLADTTAHYRAATDEWNRVRREWNDQIEATGIRVEELHRRCLDEQTRAITACEKVQEQGRELNTQIEATSRNVFEQAERKQQQLEILWQEHASKVEEHTRVCGQFAEVANAVKIHIATVGDNMQALLVEWQAAAGDTLNDLATARHECNLQLNTLRKNLGPSLERLARNLTELEQKQASDRAFLRGLLEQSENRTTENRKILIENLNTRFAEIYAEMRLRRS